MSIADYFRAKFDSAPSAKRFTPGRVNLIGEHTDYNGGAVLPTALPLGISAAMSPRRDNQVHIISDKFETIAKRDLSEKADDSWSDYVLGAVKIANEAGLMSGGANIALQSNLSFGAGISSSAATAVGILKLAREIKGSSESDTDISVLARKVETDFIGMPCGIMDQMAVAIAHPGQALHLNTATLDYDLVDIPEDYHMAVVHSGVFRKLSEGRYKIRKEECDVVKAAAGREDICLLSDEDLAALTSLDDHIYRRAKHCVTEHRRTEKAAIALGASDMDTLGALMNESQISMRDDFEITVPDIDAICDTAVELGALGARMTGGGFGGCIVACVPKAELESWKTKLLSAHEKAFYVC